MEQSPFSWPSDWSQAWPEGKAVGSGVGDPHRGTGKDKERKGSLWGGNYQGGPQKMRRNQLVALGRVSLESEASAAPSSWSGGNAGWHKVCAVSEVR